MNHVRSMCTAALCGAVLLGTLTVRAAEVKTYQVTGPVLELTPTTIVVQKDKDRWEIIRDSKTKISGGVKVGAKVTVVYKMVAQEVEAKEVQGKK